MLLVYVRGTVVDAPKCPSLQPMALYIGGEMYYKKKRFGYRPRRRYGYARGRTSYGRRRYYRRRW